MELTRGAVEEMPRRLLNRGRAGNPDVWLIEAPAGPVVLKDFAQRPGWLRRTWAPVCIRREARAYRALAGHPSVPRILQQLDSMALILEYRPGRPLSRRVRRHLPRDFFDRLRDAVTQMHERGVVHLDLRHRSNVLVDANAQPILIDFGSALCLDPRSRWLPWLARIDHRAVRKWRTRWARLASSQEEGSGAGSSERRGAS